MSLEPITSSDPPAERLAAAGRKIHALNTDVCRLVDQIDRWNGRGAAAAPVGEPLDGQASLEQLDRQIAALTGTVRELEARLRGLEDMSLAAPRKPIHVRLAEVLVGREYYRPYWRKAAVPGATIVIPVGEDDSTAATLRSVLANTGPAWEAIIVGPEPGPRSRQALDASAGRARHELANGPPWECLDKGLADAAKIGGSNLIGILHPGQRLEPTAAGAVARFFRDDPRSMVAYFERTVRRGAWRTPMPRGRRMDVYSLLAEPGSDGWGHGGVFFRRAALGMVGGYKPAMRSAAEWHLYLRLTRMFGMRRASGQAMSIDAGEASRERDGEYLEFEQARQEFLDNFGFPGRVRCRLIHVLNSLRRALEPAEPQLPPPPSGPECGASGELPECPLTGEKPDRLLFTAPGSDRALHYVYACPGKLGAMVLPANSGGKAEPAAADYAEDGEQEGRSSKALIHVVLLSKLPVNRALVVEPLAPNQMLDWQITRWPAGQPLADAALTLPEDLRFEVILAGSAVRRASDPAGLLRSLQSVLAPKGLVAFAVPNFDSPGRRRLGSRWSRWQIPRCPLILGCRGVRELARLSDLRVHWLRARDDEWWVVMQSE